MDTINMTIASAARQTVPERIGELMAELIETGKTPLRARRMFERLAPGVASG